MSPYGVTRPQWVDELLWYLVIEIYIRLGRNMIKKLLKVVCNTVFSILLDDGLEPCGVKTSASIPMTSLFAIYNRISTGSVKTHDDVIRWKHFPNYWPFVTSEFPSQRPVTQSFDVSFDLLFNKWLSKQSRGWWFEMPSCPIWRHCNYLFWHQFYCPFISYSELEHNPRETYFSIYVANLAVVLSMIQNWCVYSSIWNVE